ncbi:family 20 glycosylhydrolase [Catenovulum sediminis]|uniref:family 20 glycosylhydrolase n=1 Tax=Catenovulum sediminis TaxID=1740262 RepID=UPI00163D5BBA|nr:family 20 glycosylhydrolase [Catenovulum sediminis]
MNRFILFSLLFCHLSWAEGLTSQSQVEQFSQTLDIRYQHLTNRVESGCDEQRGSGFCFKAQLALTLPYDLQADNFAIYFSHVAPIQKDFSSLFDIEHINGDLHRLTASSSFTGFSKNQTYTISFLADYWHLSEFDMIPNYFVAVDGVEPQIIKSTVAKIDDMTQQEILPFVEPYTDYEKQFKRTPNDKTRWATSEVLYTQNQSRLMELDKAQNLIQTRVIPKVKQLQTTGDVLNIEKGIAVFVSANVDSQKIQQALNRLQKLGIKQAAEGVSLKLIKKSGFSHPSAYQVAISQQQIQINAASESGLFYGLQTLAGLYDLNTPNQLPVVNIFDEPHFDFRGVHIDVSRNFHGKDLLMTMIEQMGAYKLNKLHLHLGDDEGWRVEIPGLPELTEVGAFRCFDLQDKKCLQPQLGSGPSINTEVNGFLSVQDYIDLVQYADQHHIQVIPSFDMPGHSRAAIKAMEVRYQKLMQAGKKQQAEAYLLSDFADKTVYSSIQFYNDNTINVCMPSAYKFVDKVVSELQALHIKAGQALTKYHMGADETAGAWVDSPACKKLMKANPELQKSEDLGAYFIAKVAHLLADKGIMPAAWSDGLSHVDAENLPAKVHSNVWSVLAWDGHKTAQQHANNGWEVILSHPDVTYFDFPYEADPKERGYYWGTRSTNSYQVFQFMPDNLPVHAEIWRDRENKGYQVDDTDQKTQLKAGKKYSGIQAHLWSETTRARASVEYLFFPRLLALAERAWHQADWATKYQAGRVYNQNSQFFTQHQQMKADWTLFSHAVGGKEKLKLDRENIRYRVATPGATLDSNGVLRMNHIFPGTQLYYRIDKGEWLLYQSAVKVSGNIEVRAQSADGKRYSRILQVN